MNSFHCVVTVHQDGKLFGSSCLRTATVERTMNGLKNGIYVLNHGAFRSHGFEIHIEEEGGHSKQCAETADVH